MGADAGLRCCPRRARVMVSDVIDGPGGSSTAPLGVQGAGRDACSGGPEQARLLALGRVNVITVQYSVPL